MKIIKTYKGYSIWRCPNCDCVVTYGGEGNMKCPKCKKWMQEE